MSEQTEKCWKVTQSCIESEQVKMNSTVSARETIAIEKITWENKKEIMQDCHHQQHIQEYNHDPMYFLMAIGKLYINAATTRKRERKKKEKPETETNVRSAYQLFKIHEIWQFKPL